MLCLGGFLAYLMASKRRGLDSFGEVALWRTLCQVGETFLNW